MFKCSKNEKLIAMIKTLSAFFSSLIFLQSLIAQTDAQLRDPEYLVDQYNQLVAKHNALIEKTRNLLKIQAQESKSDNIADPQAQEKLNEAIAKAAALENQLSKMQQDQMRSSNSNKYLDDTNARLRRQLQEMKADEQALVQQNKELSAENRRLLNEKKSRESDDKDNYSKIRNLELGRSTIQRRADNLLVDNKTLEAENSKI